MTTATATEERQGAAWLYLLVGLAAVLLLAIIANRLTHWSGGWGLPGSMGKALEYPVWAVLAGLVANAIFNLTRTRSFVQPGIRSELYIKVGLILMGASVNFTTIVKAGGGGVVQAVIMVTTVFLFCWWLAGRFQIPDTLRAVMATAISICGVSAAIAAAGSVMAKKSELTYIVGLVIVTALPLMVIMPPLAQAMGLSPEVAGAWFGGNVDTTAAVVGAGAIHSERAKEIASIVKMSQNALMGVAAFLLTLYFVTVVEKGERPSARIIWDRFPKFVLGFIIMSILASAGLFASGHLSVLKSLSTWAFAFAFVCLGIELSFAEMGKMGWPPIIVYIIVTIFNTVLALVVASVIFGVIFPAPA